MGVPVNAAEARGTAITVAPDGAAHVVVAARGWVLVVDAATGSCTQVPLPDDSYPFACLATRDGRFLTGGAGWVVEIDPVTGHVTSQELCPGEEVVGMAWAEGLAGEIWLTTYPSALLVRWDRRAGTFSPPLPLSADDHYATHLAVDGIGWVYAGIGTTQRTVVAVPPGSREVRALLAAEGTGSGQARRATDGTVHVSVDADGTHPDSVDVRWATVLGGEVAEWQPSRGKPVPDFETLGSGFARIHCPVQVSWRVAELDLPEHRLTLVSAGGPRSYQLSYTCAGADLSPFVRVPGGGAHLIGTSNHPLQLWSADLADGRTQTHGRRVVAPADGNVAAWAAWGTRLAGISYTEGRLHLFDPDQPWRPGHNPVFLGEHRQVYRPRCAVVVGDLLVAGGYGGYGDTGGGLALVELPSGRSTALSHLEVVAHQATTTLVGLGPSLVVGATSVDAPGGAGATTTSATAYLLDLDRRSVRHRWQPVPDVATWSASAVDANGRVHLVSRDGLHAVTDPYRPGPAEIVATTDLGPMAYGGSVRTTDGWYLVHERGVVSVDLANHAVSVVHRSEQPLTAGGAVVDGTLYVGSGPELLGLRLG